MSEGPFDNKTVDEAWDYLNNLAEKSMSWFHSAHDVSPMAHQVPSGSDTNFANQIAQLTKRMEEFAICENYGQMGHNANGCQKLASRKKWMAYQNQSQVLNVNAIQKYDPNSQSCNPGWKDHPNLGWGSSQSPPVQQALQFVFPPPPPPPKFPHLQGQAQPHWPPISQRSAFSSGPPQGNSYVPPNKRTFEVQQPHASNNDMEANWVRLNAIKRVSQQEWEALPSQVPPNPAGMHYVGSSLGAPLVDQAQPINTLWSGKEVDETIPPKPTPPVSQLASPFVMPTPEGKEPLKEKIEQFDWLDESSSESEWSDAPNDEPVV